MFVDLFRKRVGYQDNERNINQISREGNAELVNEIYKYDCGPHIHLYMLLGQCH